jgi:organic radical activating enzyme
LGGARPMTRPGVLLLSGVSPSFATWRVAFCAFDRRLDRPRRVAGREEVLAFGRVLGDYQRSTGERVMVSWIGGEPLLWPAVFEVSRQLQQEHGLSISATTNGTTLHQGQRAAADFGERFPS